MVSIQSDVHLKPKLSAIPNLIRPQGRGEKETSKKQCFCAKHQLAQNLTAAVPLLELTSGFGW